jgi:FdhE protein
MSYVGVAPGTRDSRLAIAASRWDSIQQIRPDLGPAVDLQRTLIGLVIDLTGNLERSRLPKLSLPSRYLAAKLRKGTPALAGEPIPMPTAVLKPVLLQLCRELARGGAGAAADHIHDVIDAGSLEAGSLLAGSLARDQNAIRTAAAHRGLASDLLWLVAELAVSPFAYALQRMLVSPHGQPLPDAALGAAFDEWRHGYCPMCGSWPAIVESLAGARVLRCSFCALAWSLPGIACLYCGEAGSAFVISNPDPARPDRRLEVCGSCRSYVKTVDVVEPSPFPLLAIADLETMDLDVLAMQQGYQRPALRNFGAIKTSA